jgi:glycosyltransferase involved in cell wall biosynthesis
LRIALIDNSRGWGGAEQVLLSLSIGMRSRGHEIAVFLREGAATVEPFRREGFDVRPIPRQGLALVRGLLQVIRPARRERFDLIHVHRNHDVLVGKAAAIAAGAPLLLTQHCLLGTMSARHIGLADRIVTVSRYIGADMEARYPSLAGKVEVIHNGIDLAPFDHPQPEYWRNVPAVADARPLLGVVGYFYKNQEELIGLLPRIRERLPGAMLIIIGRDDEKRNGLERVAQACGVSDAVYFAGRIPHAEMGDAMASLDFNVSAFRREGCALNVIESLAAGTPFVGYRAGSYPELVVDGETGMLADSPEDFVRILARLMERPETTEEMRWKAREDARARFDVRRMVDRYEELYARMATDGR